MVVLFSGLGTVTLVEIVLGNVVEGWASRQQAWCASSHGGPNSKFLKTHAVPMEPDISPSLQASQQSCKSKKFALVNTVLLLLHLVFISEVLHNDKSWFGCQACWNDTVLYWVSFLPLGWPPNQDSPMVLQFNSINWNIFERTSEM